VILGETLMEAPEPVTVTLPPSRAAEPTKVDAVLEPGGVAEVPALLVTV
jgi:hypothetical protein